MAYKTRIPLDEWTADAPTAMKNHLPHNAIILKPIMCFDCTFVEWEYPEGEDPNIAEEEAEEEEVIAIGDEGEDDLDADEFNDEFDEMSYKDLRERAKDLDIDDFHKMNTDELREAVRSLDSIE